MKFWKHILVAGLAFFGVSSTVLFTACEQDSCLDLKCINGGTCADGYCRCVQGFEGPQCEIKANTKFLGKYYGSTECNAWAPIVDSAVVFEVKSPNRIGLKLYSDSTDVLYTTVTGNSIVAKDSVTNRDLTITVDNKKITIRIEEQVNGKPQNCTFTGNRL
jgi:hypothetical protein